MLTSIIIIALVAVSLLFFLVKNGWKLCHYCTGFWICALLTALYGFGHGWNWHLIAYPLASAAITGSINKFLHT
jgi:uncharacterized membrane protein